MRVYEKFSDSELLILLKNSDYNAFSEIYERYKGILYVHAHRRLHNSTDAEDVIQDLFTTLWNKRIDLQITEKLSAYLYTAVRNRILKIFARQKVKTNYLDDMRTFFDEGHFVTDHLLRTKDLSRIIEKEVEALPEKMRQIFIMSRFEHLNHKEIAEILQISEQTVSKQITNALRILRVRLGLFAYILFLIKY